MGGQDHTPPPFGPRAYHTIPRKKLEPWGFGPGTGRLRGSKPRPSSVSNGGIPEGLWASTTCVMRLMSRPKKLP